MRSATLAPPPFCGGPGAGADGLCGGKSFAKVEGSEMCKDYQEIKIQEQVQHLGMGSMPRGIMVLLLLLLLLMMMLRMVMMMMMTMMMTMMMMMILSLCVIAYTARFTSNINAAFVY